MFETSWKQPFILLKCSCNWYYIKVKNMFRHFNQFILKYYVTNMWRNCSKVPQICRFMRFKLLLLKQHISIFTYIIFVAKRKQPVDFINLKLFMFELTCPWIIFYNIKNTQYFVPNYFILCNWNCCNYSSFKQITNLSEQIRFFFIWYFHAAVILSFHGGKN